MLPDSVPTAGTPTLEMAAAGDPAPAPAAAPVPAGDTAAKLARLRELLAARGAASLALTSREALAWLFDGARVTVPIGGDPVCSAVVTGESAVLHVFENEADRMLAEELPPLGDAGVELRRVPWHAPLPGTPAAAGIRAAELAEADVAGELRALRARLLPAELDRARRLGRELATAVTSVLRTAHPETSERALAGALADAVYGLGAEPVVLLVAGRDRLGLRHPLPTGAPLGTRAMAVVGARRHGLITNLTRWLGGEPGAADTASRLAEVEADAFAATRPGRALHEVLADIAAAYERHGFGAEEWLRHHQGGPTGYAGRDPRATPAAGDLVVDGQLFAWNPTAPRHKLEDTVRIAGGAVEVLTADPAWPAVEVRGVGRPLDLPFGAAAPARAS